MTYVTAYVPISKFIKTEDGERHIIASFEEAISKETYDKLCNINAEDIENRVTPIVSDLKTLLNHIKNDEFTYDFDKDSVCIYHEYCPTLDRNRVIGIGKEYKGLSDKQRVEKLKEAYIKDIEENIQSRLNQAHDIISDFEYHPIQININELDLMLEEGKRIEDADIGELVETAIMDDRSDDLETVESKINAMEE